MTVFIHKKGSKNRLDLIDKMSNFKLTRDKDLWLRIVEKVRNAPMLTVNLDAQEAWEWNKFGMMMDLK